MVAKIVESIIGSALMQGEPLGKHIDDEGYRRVQNQFMNARKRQKLQEQ